MTTTSVEAMPDRHEPMSGGSLRSKAKLRRKLAQLSGEGLGAVLRKAFKDHVYRTREYVILEWLPVVGQSYSDAPVQRDVRVVGPDDEMPDLSRYFASQAAGTEATIRAGCIGTFAMKDGDVVGISLISRQDYWEPSDRNWFPVRDGEAYQFGWLVAPDQRSFAVASRLVKVSTGYLAALGCRRTYCAVDTWNTNSLGSLLFMGFQEAGECVTSHRLLRWSWTTRETYQEPKFKRYQRNRAGRTRSSG